MNRFLNSYTLVILFLVLIATFTSCSDDDDYKKFLEGGEIYYPAKILAVDVLSGRDRVVLTGYFYADPKVVQCLVYWNGRRDSAVFDVVRTDILDSLYESIDLDEGIHNFEFYTLDEDGNRSIPVFATGESFGDTYETQLLNRPFSDTTFIDSPGLQPDTLIIAWGGIDLTSGAYETDLQYNIGSNAKTIKVPVRTDTTVISGYDGTGFRYRTFFRPTETAVDVFWTDFRVVE